MMEVIQYLMANWAVIISAIVGLLASMLVIALLIPGEQPDKFLQSAVDFLKKFSIK